MFDIGFSELLLFGVIALIVLGPEKLPKAARMAGQWYAKLRRTVATLQSEIEAEFDLAETRQQMQDELAKIRQTEADMKREMAEMRGNMQAFKQSQNQSLNASHQPDSHNQDEPKQGMPAEFAYAYHQDISSNKSQTYQQNDRKNDSENSNTDDTHLADASDYSTAQPIITRPWENMWFRLGAYDKARRLPPAPHLPNYKADILLYSHFNKPVANETILSTEHNTDTDTEVNIKASVDKQEANK